MESNKLADPSSMNQARVCVCVLCIYFTIGFTITFTLAYYESDNTRDYSAAAAGERGRPRSLEPGFPRLAANERHLALMRRHFSSLLCKCMRQSASEAHHTAYSEQVVHKKASRRKMKCFTALSSHVPFLLFGSIHIILRDKSNLFSKR